MFYDRAISAKTILNNKTPIFPESFHLFGLLFAITKTIDPLKSNRANYFMLNLFKEEESLYSSLHIMKIIL